MPFISVKSIHSVHIISAKSEAKQIEIFLNMIRIARCDLVNNASRFAKAGLGYIITLDKLINTTGSSELCFRPLSPKLEASLYIVWKKNQIFSKAAELFLKRLQSKFTETP